MKELRGYQKEISIKANEILKVNKIVYLAMEVRTGKTATSLNIANLYGAENVLFITKKKAIQSILNDFKDFNFNYNLNVINNESLHLNKGEYDLIISDEHHRNGAFPKPNKCTKLIKEKFSHLPMVFLSGTPTPESYSQIYHQFWLSAYSPFRQYVNFYKWANEYVNVKKKYLGYAEVNDYSEAKQELIKKSIDKYMISFTQEQAGFTTSVKETILFVDMLPIIHKIANKLKKDKVFEGKNDLIIADTGAKMMSKLHQLYSGTVILESGNYQILDMSKLCYIEDNYSINKIAIFYKFQAEKEMIQKFYGDRICFDLETFDNTNKNIACQLQSFREGVSLRNAEYIIFLNIEHSAVTYFQAKDRMTTIERKNNEVIYLFAKGGIESYIFKTVSNKKNFTLSHFNRYLKE